MRPAGSGTLYWQRNCWVVRIVVDGQDHSERVHAPNTKAGRRQAEQALDALRSGLGPTRRAVGGRYPLHEVERRLGWPTAAAMAEVLGVSVATVKAWRVRGLSWRQADEVACRLLAVHPMSLWPEWLDDSAPATPPPRQSRAPYQAESGLDIGRRLVDA